MVEPQSTISKALAAIRNLGLKYALIIFSFANLCLWIVTGSQHFVVAAAIAVALNPVVLLSLPIALQLIVLTHQMQSMCRRVELAGLEKSVSGINRLERLHDLCDKLRLAPAVPLAYRLWSYNLASRRIDPHINGEADLEGESVRHCRAESNALQVAVAAMVVGRTRPGKADRKALQPLLASVTASTGRVYLSSIIESTFLDGSGILSTLNLALRVCLAAALPLPERTDFLKQFSDVTFDPPLLGWLGGRLFQLSLERFANGQSASLSDLESWIAEASATLSCVSGDSAARLGAQYVLREDVMGHLHTVQARQENDLS